jgi:hypothetical protein
MLLDGSAEELMATLIEAGLAGDMVSARFCAGRSLGTRRGQPVMLDDDLGFPEVSGPGDLGAVVAAITRSLAEGRVTPEEALDLSQMIDGFPRVLAAAAAEPLAEEGDDPLEELERRLTRLAARLKEDEAAAAREAQEAGGAEAASSVVGVKAEAAA